MCAREGNILTRSLSTTVEAPTTVRARRLFRNVVAGGEYGSLVERLLTEPKASWGEVREIDQTSHSRVGFVEVGGKTLCVKVYEIAPLRRHQSLLRESRGCREFHALKLLHENHGNPMRAVGWGELRVLGFCVRGVVVTEAWTHALDGRQFRMQHPRGARTAEEARKLFQLATEVIDQMREVHDSGICLKDCRDRNLLLEWPATDELLRWTWIDLPHLTRGNAPLTWGCRLEDLLKLDRHGAELFTRTERWRLWCRYAQDEWAGQGEQLRSLFVLGERRASHSMLRRFSRWLRSSSRETRRRRRQLGVRVLGDVGEDSRES